MLKASKHEATFKIRNRLRPVGDYHVDRRQVQASQGVQPRRTNPPIRTLERNSAKRVKVKFVSCPAKLVRAKWECLIQCNERREFELSVLVLHRRGYTRSHSEHGS